jgi:hypothetical protein
VCKLLPLLLLGLLGCGAPTFQYVPVAGHVTLNGKAVENASVEFQPIAATKGVDPGPGSMGITNKDGRFTLKSQLVANQNGAVVGKHQVRIYVYQPAGSDDRDADARAAKKASVVIPEKYSSKSELVVDVPAAGLPDHHFDLK